MNRVDLKLGFACNNHCQFCVQGDKRLRHGARTKEQILENLREGAREGATDLVLTGGEPTVHKTLLYAAGAAKSLGYRTIQIQSNGRRFCDRAFCRELIASGINQFAPSIHGSRPEIHDSLTQSPGSFKQTLTGIRNLKNLKQQVITNTVITQANYRDLPNLARLLVSVPVDKFQFAFPHILGSAAKNQAWIVPRVSRAMPYVRKGLDVGRAAAIACTTEAVPYCLMQGYEAFVAERQVSHTRIYDADHVTEDFLLWRTQEGKVKGPRCRKCLFFYVCEGPWREYPQMYGWSEFKPVLQ